MSGNEDQIKETKTQGRAAIAAVLVSIVALILSIIGLVFQFTALRDQQRLTALQLDNDRTRYASRVSWYYLGPRGAGDTSNGRTVITNRSLVPISRPVLVWDTVSPPQTGFGLRTIPPCTEVEFSSSGGIVPTYDPLRLLFADAKGEWSVESGGAPAAIDFYRWIAELGPRERARALLKQSFTAQRPADDCGAG
ncbi:hypothetical protein GCM10023203_37990 [Actinomycetospora straminea]|uniref:Uncharacterized protein n=1 Tax=Actinomycetospora straminea TaxID=663607 RepID=A0ABP9EQ90_9PSEU